MARRDDNIAVFIDGSNLYATAKTLGFDIDYALLPKMFEDMGNVLRMFYFTAVKPEAEHSTLRPLLDYLDYNGYIVVQKYVKEYHDAATGRTKIKGNMDIEMVTKMFKTAPHVEHMVLFTGDGDFRDAVEMVQDLGCHVSVVSTIQTSPPMIADELRRQCDTFIELNDHPVRTLIARTRKHLREA